MSHRKIPKTRADAKRKRCIVYQSGEDCAQGHKNPLRYTKTGKCKECVAELSRRKHEKLQQARKLRAEQGPPDGPVMVVFGETFWPRPAQYSYSYRQCRAAARYIQCLLSLANGTPPLASQIRFTLGPLYDLDRCTRNLIEAMADAMEANPTGPTTWPPVPPDLRW